VVGEQLVDVFGLDVADVDVPDVRQGLTEGNTVCLDGAWF
jgi:hypothetical protein